MLEEEATQGLMMQRVGAGVILSLQASETVTESIVLKKIPTMQMDTRCPSQLAHP